jgi:hypothetical protein
MASLTEFVAAVVVHSSAAAFSHFGVTIETPEIRRVAPAAEPPWVARSRRPDPEKAAACPEPQAKARSDRA